MNLDCMVAMALGVSWSIEDPLDGISSLHYALEYNNSTVEITTCLCYWSAQVLPSMTTVLPFGIFTVSLSPRSVSSCIRSSSGLLSKLAADSVYYDAQ
jgi:hypothetical protein